MFLEFPLLKREFIALLRTRRAFWLLIVLVVLSCSLPLLAWPAPGMTAFSAEITLGIFLTFVMTQLSVALLIIPAFTAGAIAGERERNTYELLYTTLLPPWSIVLSKVFASVGYVLLILLATAPALCVLHLMGGVSFEAVLVGLVVTFVAVANAGVICLTVSMRSRTTAHAVVRGVIWMIFWNGGLMLLILLGMGLVAISLDRRGTSSFLELMAPYVMSLCPYPAIGFLVFPERPFTGLWMPIWTMFVAYSGTVGLFHFVYLLRRVRMPEMQGTPARQRRALRRGRRPAGPRVVRRSLFTSFVLGLGESGWPWLRNPIFLKEVRSEFFGRLWYRRAMFWVPFLICLLISWMIGQEVRDLEGQFISIGMLSLSLVVVFAPGVAAGTLPREKEQGNLDLLRGTLVPLRAIVYGKYLASLFSVWGLLCMTGLVTWLSPVLQAGTVNAEKVIWGYFVTGTVLPVTALFTLSLAMFFSAISRKTIGALLSTYLTLIGLFIFLPIVLSIAMPYSFLRDHEALRVLTWASHAFLAFGQSVSDFNGFGGQRFARCLGTVASFTALYGGAALVLLWLAGLFFEKLRARD